MRVTSNNYYKNFETGQEIQFDKVKPQQNMINECKIELFNLDNKKIEECVSENVVGNVFNRYFVQMLCLNQIFNKYSRTSDKVLANLFGTIALTTNSDSEDANMKYIKGSTIGWANRFSGYVGADPKRGSINFAESKVLSKNSVKFVFDFPSNSSNGTFQSIYWMPGYEITAGERYQPEICTIEQYSSSTNEFYDSPSAGYYGSMCVINNETYYVNRSTFYKRIHKYSVQDYKDYTITLAMLKEIDPKFRGIQFDGTYFWSYGSLVSKMFKFDANFNVIDSWNIDSSYISSYCQFCFFKNKLFFIKYVDSTHLSLYKLNLTGTLEATYNLYTENSNFNTYGTKNDTHRMITDGNTLIILVGSTGTNVSSYSYSIIEVDEHGNILADYGSNSHGSLVAMLTYNNDHKMIESYYGDKYYLFKEPSSHVLLPTPVTKTSSNNMKLSFTFNIDLSNM